LEPALGLDNLDRFPVAKQLNANCTYLLYCFRYGCNKQYLVNKILCLSLVYNIKVGTFSNKFGKMLSLESSICELKEISMAFAIFRIDYIVV
jgi:hypothetical protein